MECYGYVSFTGEDMYDGILCLCDSFNYLLKEEDVEQHVTGCIFPFKR